MKLSNITEYYSSGRNKRKKIPQNFVRFLRHLHDLLLLRHLVLSVSFSTFTNMSAQIYNSHTFPCKMMRQRKKGIFPSTNSSNINKFFLLSLSHYSNLVCSYPNLNRNVVCSFQQQEIHSVSSSISGSPM